MLVISRIIYVFWVIRARISNQIVSRVSLPRDMFQTWEVEPLHGGVWSRDASRTPPLRQSASLLWKQPTGRMVPELPVEPRCDSWICLRASHFVITLVQWLIWRNHGSIRRENILQAVPSHTIRRMTRRRGGYQDYIYDVWSLCFEYKWEIVWYW